MTTRLLGLRYQKGTYVYFVKEGCDETVWKIIGLCMAIGRETTYCLANLVGWISESRLRLATTEEIDEHLR